MGRTAPNRVSEWVKRSALVAAALSAFAHPLSAAPAKRPTFDRIEAVLREELATLRLGEHDLASLGAATKLLARVEQTGWKLPADAKSKLLARFLADNHPLVQKLHTAGGRTLMAKVGRMPLGYDRLDRLSDLPQGRETLSALVRGPDGHKLIDYMTSTPGGKALGKQLSNTPQGKNFNQPTGRLYTAAQLLAELKTFFDAQN